MANDIEIIGTAYISNAELFDGDSVLAALKAGVTRFVEIDEEEEVSASESLTARRIHNERMAQNTGKRPNYIQSETSTNHSAFEIGRFGVRVINEEPEPVPPAPYFT